MSAPIKPPSGPKGLPETALPETGPAITGTEGAFKGAIDEAQATSAADVVAKDAAAIPADAIREVAAELRAGKIDAAQVVERILGRTLASPTAMALTPAGRVDLEKFLRRTLEEDPGLAALVKDLERGR